MVHTVGRIGHRLGVLALLAIVVVASTAGAGGVLASSAAGQAADVGVGPVEQAEPPDNATTTPPPTTTANNTTQHEDPENVTERGDLTAIQGWLSGSMIESLRGSSIQLSQHEYELARKLMGSEYDTDLARYVDVAGETGDTKDDDAGEAFEDAQDQQRDLADDTESFDETLEAYQEARAENDFERARNLAREILEHSTEIHRDADRLEETNRRLENSTGVEDPMNIESIDQLVEEIDNETAMVVEREFVETTLTLTAVSERGSFAEPVEIQGTIGVPDGPAITNQTVRLAVGERTYSVQVDANGSFALSYRPLWVEPGERSLSVRYLPSPEEPYLGANASRPVTIEQAETNLSLTRPNGSVGFGDPVRVDGRLEAGGVGVPGLTVGVGVAGDRIGTAETSGNGTIESGPALPAGVQPGTQTLVIETGTEAPALAPAQANASIQVVETETSLSAEVTQSEETVIAEGQLTTDDETPIANQPIRLIVNDSRIETGWTDDTGAYRIAMGAGSLPEGEQVVTARFDGSGTNLLESAATDHVLVSHEMLTAGPTESATSTSPGGAAADTWSTARIVDAILGAVFGPERFENGLDWLFTAIYGAIAVIVLRFGHRLLGWWRGPGAGREYEYAPDAGDTRVIDDPTGGVTGGPTDVFADLEGREAIIEGYARVRERLASAVGIEDHDRLTVREFEAAVADRHGGLSAALGTVTDRYERVRFRGESIQETALEEFRSAATALLTAAGPAVRQADGRGPGEEHPDAVDEGSLSGGDESGGTDDETTGPEDESNGQIEDRKASGQERSR